MLARPGDADVEEAAFLGDLLGGGGQHERQAALVDADDGHGVPFQALGGVQGRQGDALPGRRVLGAGAGVELGDEVGDAGVGVGAATNSSPSPASADQDSQRSRAPALARRAARW